MGFEDSLQKYKHTIVWLSLILVNVLFITPSYSYENCKSSGEFVCHETKLSQFYICTGYKEGALIICPDGLVFDPVIKVCNWPGNNDCSNQIDQSKTTKFNDAEVTTKPSTKSVVTTKPPTKSVVTTKPSTKSVVTTKPSTKSVVTTNSNTFKRSSLLSKIMSTTTSKPQPTGPCQPEHCKLPNCKCPGPEIPGSLPTNSTPQIILLTFDDGIYQSYIAYYRNLFNANLTNPNGCPIQATFFVSDSSYSSPESVKELYDQGHEIASHSMTHKFPIDFWSNADYNDYFDEIVGMKNWLSKKANISNKDIRGMRTPFLAIGKDAQYEMLQDNGFYYDSSMVAGSSSSNTKEKPTWPFTLDHTVNSTYCALPNCPVKQYPGLWEVPLVRWYNDKTGVFSMADENKAPQYSSDVVDYLKYNFDRHYERNKAPLGIFLHMPWLKKNLDPLQKFLKEVSLKDDVWIVTVSQALEWIQNPVPLNNISQFKSWSCNKNN